MKDRIKSWCNANGYLFIKIANNQVEMKRKSDNYPFSIDKRLLEQIVVDDGF